VVGGGAAAGGGGAGAGAELGGAGAVAGDELPPPDPPEAPDEPEELDEPEEPEEPGEPDEPDEPEELAADWPVCAAAWTPPAEVAPATLWRCVLAVWAWECPGDGHAVIGFAIGVYVTWLAGWAGAVRTNKVTMPTAATALISVARQVSRLIRCSPTARASSGNSSMAVVGGPPAREMAVGESRYGSPVPWA